MNRSKLSKQILIEARRNEGLVSPSSSVVGGSLGENVAGCGRRLVSAILKDTKVSSLLANEPAAQPT